MATIQRGVALCPKTGKPEPVVYGEDGPICSACGRLADGRTWEDLDL